MLMISFEKLNQTHRNLCEAPITALQIWTWTVTKHLNERDYQFRTELKHLSTNYLGSMENPKIKKILAHL